MKFEVQWLSQHGTLPEHTVCLYTFLDTKKKKEKIQESSHKSPLIVLNMPVRKLIGYVPFGNILLHGLPEALRYQPLPKAWRLSLI